MKKLMLMVLLAGCQPLAEHDREGDLFFVRSDGVDLPVWVRGATESGVFIVLLPGGPGTSGIYAYPLSQGFAELEKKYAVVYMDQRGAGSTQGNATQASINLEQFVLDTQRVIATVRARHQVRDLVLMGHSWGGMLGTQYLLEHPEGIAGWIEVDGAHNVKKGDALAVEWTLRRAQELLDAGERPEFWRAALAWYGAHPVVTNETILQHSRYSWEAMDKTLVDESHVPDAYAFDRIFFSASDGLALITQMAFSQYGRKTPTSFWGDTPLTTMFHDVDLTPRMREITMPSLVLWGANDVVLPMAMADDAVQALGSADKHAVIFPHAAHNPFDEEPAAFAAAVIPFVDSLVTAQ